MLRVITNRPACWSRHSRCFRFRDFEPRPFRDFRAIDQDGAERVERLAAAPIPEPQKAKRKDAAMSLSDADFLPTTTGVVGPSPSSSPPSSSPAHSSSPTPRSNENDDENSPMMDVDAEGGLTMEGRLALYKRRKEREVADQRRKTAARRPRWSSVGSGGGGGGRSSGSFGESGRDSLAGRSRSGSLGSRGSYDGGANMASGGRLSSGSFSAGSGGGGIGIGTPPLRPLSAATLASLRRRSGDARGCGPPPLPAVGPRQTSRRSTGTSLLGGPGSGGSGRFSGGSGSGSGGKPPPAARRRATLCAAGGKGGNSNRRSTAGALARRRRPLSSIQAQGNHTGASTGSGSKSSYAGAHGIAASSTVGEPSAKRPARPRSNAIVDDNVHGNGHDDDDDDDAFVPPSLKLALASSSSDEDDAGSSRRNTNASATTVLHFDGLDSPDAVLPPSFMEHCSLGDDDHDNENGGGGGGGGGDDDEDEEEAITAQKIKRRKKKRRNTTLFVPPPPPPVAETLAEEEDGRHGKRDGASPVEEEEGTANVDMADTAKDDEIDQKEEDAEEVDYKSLCQTYKDEHASLRFLLGILKLEKADAESRLGQLSEAFEAKSAQNKTMATQLTELRRENGTLKTAAVDKQREMDSLLGTLQMQMMTGLSAAVEKTKTLQAQLEAMAAEKERLEEELEELRG